MKWERWWKVCLMVRSGFPGGWEVKASASNAGAPGSIPRSGRPPGEGNGNPLQYSCLENPMLGGAWWATVHGVAKSRTQLSNFTSLHFKPEKGFPDGASGKESAYQCWRCRRCGFYPWIGKITWQPTPVFMPGESHGQRSLAGYKWLQRVVCNWSDLAHMQV